MIVCFLLRFVGYVLDMCWMVICCGEVVSVGVNWEWEVMGVVFMWVGM